MKLYNFAIKLRGQGLRAMKIAKIIERKYGIRVGTSTIYDWAKGRHPLRGYNKITNGPELAYVLGAWLGDGSLVHSGYRHCVRLSVRDRDFAEEWGRCLAIALGRTRPYTPRWEKSSRRWLVEANSILLYKLLKKAADHPWILLPYLESYPQKGCKGFFDAEGSVVVRNYRIVAANTNRDLINLIGSLLRSIGICFKIYEEERGQLNQKTIYVIVISKRENILRYAREVGFSIARKQVALARLLARYEAPGIPRRCLESVARTLIAMSLIRQGLVKTQREAAELLSVSQSTLARYLHNKRRTARLSSLPQIKRLSKEFMSFKDGDTIIREVKKIVETSGYIW